MMGPAWVLEVGGLLGFFFPVPFLLASGHFRAAFVYPVEDAGKCLGIEPDAVVPARVDNDSADAPVIEPIHQFAAHHAGPIESAPAALPQALPGAARRRQRKCAKRERFVQGALDQLAECFVPQPEASTPSTLQNSDLLPPEAPANETMLA
jgi:hypothetical protein